MLAEIGIMVGFYIMTKMLALERTKEGKVTSFTRVFSAVTFIVTALVVLDLVFRGFSASSQIPTF